MMKINLPDDEYTEHMDRLVIRISEVLDGEDYFDAASANAALIAYALKELYPPRTENDGVGQAGRVHH